MRGEEGEDSAYAVGKTKVFIAEEMWRELCVQRDKIFTRAAIVLQSYIRMFLCRRRWPDLQATLRQSPSLQTSVPSHSRYWHPADNTITST